MPFRLVVVAHGDCGMDAVGQGLPYATRGGRTVRWNRMRVPRRVWWLPERTASAALTELVRPGIPEIAIEAHRGEDPAHLLGLRAVRFRLETRRVPRRRHDPEL